MWDKDMLTKEYLGEVALPLDDWFRGEEGSALAFDDPANQVRSRTQVCGSWFPYVNLRIRFTAVLCEPRISTGIDACNGDDTDQAGLRRGSEFAVYHGFPGDLYRARKALQTQSCLCSSRTSLLPSQLIRSLITNSPPGSNPNLIRQKG